MPRQKRKYTQEFKQESVKLALQSESISGVAKELGIPESTLFKWIEDFKKPGLGLPKSKDVKQDMASLYEENRRLNKEIGRLREEKEILKKAAAYFARESK